MMQNKLTERFYMARPKSENPKNRTVHIRLTADDYVLLSRGAQCCDLSLSAFLRGQGKRAALIILSAQG